MLAFVFLILGFGIYACSVFPRVIYDNISRLCYIGFIVTSIIFIDSIFTDNIVIITRVDSWLVWIRRMDEFPYRCVILILIMRTCLEPEQITFTVGNMNTGNRVCALAFTRAAK